MSRTKRIASLMALALIGGTPALAQYSGPYNGPNNGTSANGWDRDAYWRGAPADLNSRIDFTQRRIDRGVQDGTLTRREATNLNRELSMIRGDARRRMTPVRRDRLQARLDNLGSRVRWQRGDGDRFGSRDGYRDDRTGYRDDRGAVGDNRFATNYDASRDYRDDPRYTERQLSANDEVYRGSDGRYYCKRNDGTTGLIIGAVGGGVLGNVIDGGRQRAAGTLIGGALGALLGRSVEQNSANVRCR